MSHDLAYTKGVFLIDYGREVEEEIAKLQTLIEENAALVKRYSPRWLAMKLLEEDSDIVPKVRSAPGGAAIMAQAQGSVKHLRDIHGDDVDTIIADRRYGFISGLIRETMTRTIDERLTTSDQIDRIVTNRILGLPIFLVAMWIVFQMTANVSGAYLDWVDGAIGGPITRWVVAILGWVGLGGSWVESLLVDGVIAGVGGVVVFVPVLSFLYFFIAILEDSGYMARAAFVMDRLMHALGLHGKSFIPMLIGFGCSVPGIYATRTLENENDRILTGLLVPFMSCAARLPVYVIFAAAFFPENSAQVIFWLYMLGIAVAVVTGMVFKRTLFGNKPPSSFVLELPPYRMPTLKGVLIHMWERSSAFVRKAGGIILITSIVIWFLMSIPWGVENPRHSLFGQVSAAVAPIFAPAGYGNWETVGPLVTGFIAKEMVVGTMSEIYAAGEEEAAEEEEVAPTFFEDVGQIVTTFIGATVDTVKMTVSIIPGIDLMGEEEEEEEAGLIAALQGAFTPLTAVAFMVFVLLYTPCMVAVAAQRQEYGTKWMLFSATYMLVLAWVVSVIVYQGGMLLGFG
jgi:ferrous iron transport protein B